MLSHHDPDKLHKGASPQLFHFARVNRRSLTKPEKILWHALRNRNLMGHKFRRQHPIGDFIADFFCLDKNLVIEVDGKYHVELSQHQYDCGRTFELEELGMTVIRFSNEEVIHQLGRVLAVIKNFHLENRLD